MRVTKTTVALCQRHNIFYHDEGTMGMPMRVRPHPWHAMATTMEWWGRDDNDTMMTVRVQLHLHHQTR